MEKADYNIASVTKALQLIDLLSRKNGQLSVQALAEKLDVSPSNVTRLLQTMRDAGFVEKSPKTNRYLLSNKFYVVTSNMLYSNECIQKYLPVAQRVAAWEKCGDAGTGGRSLPFRGFQRWEPAAGLLLQCRQGDALHSFGTADGRVLGGAGV